MEGEAPCPDACSRSHTKNRLSHSGMRMLWREQPWHRSPAPQRLLRGHHGHSPPLQGYSNPLRTSRKVQTGA